jgi:prevent-host-death family protein
MANIRPVSDLRNYNNVLKECTAGSPVYLTKNGRGKFVLMDIGQYERDKAEQLLFEKLAESEERIRNGEQCITIEELKAELGLL